MRVEQVPIVRFIHERIAHSRCMGDPLRSYASGRAIVCNEHLRIQCASQPDFS